MTTTPVHSITDDQIAEIEALAEDCLEFDWGPDVGMTHAETVYACSVSPSSVLAIITRLREAEKDAARYRWLRNEALNMPDLAPAVVITEGSLIQQCLEGRDLDEEIDNAMQGEQ